MIEFTTPQGTRDLIQKECRSKRYLEKQFMHIFEHWGYEEVMTPMIEYYQTFTLAQMKEQEMYKILDASNRILTLRGDMTIPIARVAATKFKDSKLPLRFQYSANVFKRKGNLSGNQNESTDCGVELLGVDAPYGDVEILACALDALSILKDVRYTLEIGNRSFFRTACDLLHLDANTIDTLADLINRKSLKSLQDYVEQLPLAQDKKAFFQQLPWLCGSADILNEALHYAFDPRLVDILQALITLCDTLKQLGFAEAISIDLGKIPRMEYYTGITFEAFVEGVGISVLSGGRYNTLCRRFGRDIPAVGFAIRLDALFPLVQEETNKKRYIVSYPPHLQTEGLAKAAKLRKEAVVICNPDASLDAVQIKEESIC